MNQLANYKLQLGQVEAALTGDPENAELLSLKKDLDEIIGITEELIDDTKKKVRSRLTLRPPRLVHDRASFTIIMILR